MHRVILAVTNDLVYDQRIQKIAQTLSTEFEVLLVGRDSNSSTENVSLQFDSHWLRCRVKSGVLFYLEYNLRLLLFLLANRASIITANDLDTLIACRIASIIKRSKFVFDAHELFIDVPELLDHPIKRSIWKMIGKLFLRGSRNNYTVNDSLSKMLGKRYAINMEVIRNYPGYKSERSSRPRRVGKNIIYQGALNEGRGIIEAIRAVKLLPEYRLHIVGQGVLRSAIEKIVDASKLDSQVVIHGSLAPEALQKFTLSMDVGLNLLDDRSKNYYYSSANKHYDYIMAGIPCINMNFPEYIASNDIIKTSVLIDNLEPQSIAKAIEGLYKDSTVYDSLAANCIAAQRLFTWESQEEKILQIYNLP